MDVIKILLVEDEQEECDNFAHCIDLCERMELMATTDSARHAMELTRELDPDVVILDLELNEGNGIDYLYQLDDLPVIDRPYVVVTTNTLSKPTLQMAREHGAGFVFTKSLLDYSPAQVIGFIDRASKYFKKGVVAAPVTAPHIEVRLPAANREQRDLALMLGKIGITSNLKGHKYIIEAVGLMREMDGTNTDLSGKVFPIIARRHNTRDQNIEKAIRTAIDSDWKTTDIDILEKYYPYAVNINTGRPTVKEFLFALLER